MFHSDVSASLCRLLSKTSICEAYAQVICIKWLSPLAKPTICILWLILWKQLAYFSRYLRAIWHEFAWVVWNDLIHPLTAPCRLLDMCICGGRFLYLHGHQNANKINGLYKYSKLNVCVCLILLATCLGTKHVFNQWIKIHLNLGKLGYFGWSSLFQMALKVCWFKCLG